ncbi:MAG TPA: polysaccharide pyruvyl transferase family protein [Candidatus Paraprevotella stercorigallinarum]|nr:polysaccharide pyruvyl transferase family protein [Candidatus Paraprevotella stercorigallinarum]
MKKVGIITMHKVINYGSALQAYALQRTIEKLGYDCEIIDYIYPNEYHLSQWLKMPFWKSWILFIIQLLYGFPQKKRIKLFEAFYSRFLKLSPTCYQSREQLQNNPPHYDIYVTGSDQVWNPKYIVGDTSFMLSFVSNVPKIAYSASFATDSIPDEYRKLYKTCLNEYAAIAVREQKGVEIIKSLSEKNARVVLDPTLLLGAEEYEDIAERSTIHMDEPYILAYILGYSFNPYPYVERLIKHVQQKTGYKVCLLNISNVKMLFSHNTKRLQKVGPSEFVYLFKNASFVITTSFHGTAFSIIFNKPFYALVKQGNTDDRLISLLQLLGLTDRAIFLNSVLPEHIAGIDNTELFSSCLSVVREHSIEYLRNELGNA